MFLSKKNAEYLNKPPKTKKLQPRVLPGWEDQQQSENKVNYKNQFKTNTNNKQMEINLLGQKQEFSQVKNQNNNNQKKSKDAGLNKKIYYNWDQLNEMNNIECEKRLVESIIEPGGVKIKPTQNLLVEFFKQSKSMDPAIIGSLLLSKIQQNYPFLVKAKSLYTIQYLVKKSPTFQNYFKSQTELIKNCPQPQDNTENYRKILKTVLNVIGVPSQKSQQVNENQAISFVDPGYNDPKQQSQIKGFLSNNQKTKRPVGPGIGKKFISPNDAKKVSQPQKKNNDVFDIFDQGSTSKNTSNNILFDDLISLGQGQQQQQQQQVNTKNITFDDLLK